MDHSTTRAVHVGHLIMGLWDSHFIHRASTPVVICKKYWPVYMFF